jgi:hypothetical protein
MNLSQNSLQTFRRILSFVFLSLSVISAGGQTTIGLAPGMVAQEFQPGKTFEAEFAVSNGTDAPMAMRGYVKDWWYNENNEKLFEPPSSTPQSAANWIEVVPRFFTVPPKSSFRFKIVVTPPVNATPGGHYAAVFVESKPELTQAATADHKAVFTNIRLGALIMLTTANTAKYDINLLDALLTPPTSSHNLKVDVLLENKSNTQIFPQAQLAVLNEKNEVVAKAEGETKRFLPQQKDHVSVTWDGSLPPGDYNAILTLIYGDGKVRTQDFKFKVPS